MAKRGRPRSTVAQFFWDKIEKTPSCWIWTGKRIKGGYGQMNRHGRSVLAHRFSFELANGLIPEGLLVRHSCDNPSCVNPEHLLIGTQKDNIRDCIERSRKWMPPHKTHCPQGHPYANQEPIRWPNGKIHGCRICGYLASRRWLERKRLERRQLKENTGGVEGSC